MKILIHDNNTDFSRRWIEYCTEQRYDFERVNCLSNDIISKLQNADVLLWRWHHRNHAEVLAAQHIIASAEKMGKKVFPSFDTCWTYDNKLAQKYQLEAIGAPLVPTYIFYDKAQALNWIKDAEFPVVFKLSKGAGAKNVKLLRNPEKARKLINIAFDRGFKPVAGDVYDVMGKLRSSAARKKVDWFGKFKRLPFSLLNIYRTNKALGREKGYVYFQKFIPDLNYDTRVVIIGNRAFAFRRFVRCGDFRASGSGFISKEPESINLEFIKIGFSVSRKLGLQCVAFDFVEDANGKPFIIENSYAFPAHAECQLRDCPGYWDDELNWHEGHIYPQDVILDDIINLLN